MSSVMSVFYFIIGVFSSIFIFIACSVCVWYLIYRFYYKMKPIKSELKKVKVKPLLYRVFWQFPKQYAKDLITRDPNEFMGYGFHIIAGEQGSGKTLLMTYLLNQYRERYPHINIKTNYGYKFQDKEIESYKDILDTTNGIYGEIDVLDEVQNWFSSTQSKDFPPEMLREITQQRKFHKQIFGTSQVFTRVAKQIREQTYLVYSPTTVLGCMTFVVVRKPILDDNGIVKEWKFKKLFMFVHDDKVRNAYDTFKRVADMKNKEFVERDKQIRA